MPTSITMCLFLIYIKWSMHAFCWLLSYLYSTAWYLDYVWFEQVIVLLYSFLKCVLDYVFDEIIELNFFFCYLYKLRQALVPVMYDMYSEQNKNMVNNLVKKCCLFAIVVSNGHLSNIATSQLRPPTTVPVYHIRYTQMQSPWYTGHDCPFQKWP